VPGAERRWLLSATAALERRSAHPLARPLVRAIESELDGASAPGDGPPAPSPRLTEVSERAGQGIRGLVDGRDVVVGGRAFAVSALAGTDTGFDAVERALVERAVSRGDGDGATSATRAYVTVDGRAAAVVEYEDALRPGLDAFVGDLGALGVGRVILLSGDAPASAAEVARRVGIDEARGGLLPQDKERIVGELVDAGERVVMLGDGTNDAPALSRATVGAALAAHGGGITAEAADVVVLADDPRRLVDAIRIGRHTMRIARQSIFVGLGLSAVAMVAAALGYVPPTIGAVLQEGIDVAVIVNALRASR
jgi:cation transport ATPase